MDKAYARDDAILQARDALDKRYIVLDTETTGLREPEVVQIGIVASDGNRFSSLFKPLVPIEPGATLAHGITNEMVKSAQTIKDFWFVLNPLLTTYRIYGYNVNFDLDALNRTLVRHQCSPVVNSLGIFDLMFCYGAYKGTVNPKYGTFLWHKLESAVADCNLVWEGEMHNALADAEMTLKLLQYMANQPTSWELALDVACTHIIGGEFIGSSTIFEELLSRITYRRKDAPA